LSPLVLLRSFAAIPTETIRQVSNDKRKVMKLQAAIFGLVLLGLLSCSDDDFDSNNFRDDTSITTLNGKWKVVSFEDFTKKTTESKNQENSWGMDIIISFNDTVDPKLFSGRVTTNSVTGEFVYVDKRQFKLLSYASTLVGQPEWADKFGIAVRGDVTYEISDDRLRIYYDNKTKSVTLIKEQ